jgi:hypothetical protein
MEINEQVQRYIHTNHGALKVQSPYHLKRWFLFPILRKNIKLLIKIRETLLGNKQ